LRGLTTERGEGGDITSFFRFDDRERLAKTWRDFGGSSEELPLSELHYWEPGADHAGLIVARTLVDARGSRYSQGASIVAAENPHWGICGEPFM